jgi:hypothetical protein
MEQYTLHSPTDTTHPHPVFPVYFVHSIARPFCSIPGCWCQANKATVTKVLLAVREGELLLAEAVNLNSEEEKYKEGA